MESAMGKTSGHGWDNVGCFSLGVQHYPRSCKKIIHHETLCNTILKTLPRIGSIPSVVELKGGESIFKNYVDHIMLVLVAVSELSSWKKNG